MAKITIRGVLSAANIVTMTRNAVMGRVETTDVLQSEFNGDVIYMASIKQYLETLIGDLEHNGMNSERQGAAMELADEIANNLMLVEAHTDAIKALGGTAAEKMEELFGMLKAIAEG